MALKKVVLLASLASLLGYVDKICVNGECLADDRSKTYCGVVSLFMCEIRRSETRICIALAGRNPKNFIIASEFVYFTLIF